MEPRVNGMIVWASAVPGTANTLILTRTVIAPNLIKPDDFSSQLQPCRIGINQF